MLAAGLFRMVTPLAFGGYEQEMVTTLQVIFAVSKIDTAAGWNLMIGSSGAFVAATLPEDGARELYADGPNLITAGALNPPARATRVDGGWRITGRTPFASGCYRAPWFGMLCAEMDGDSFAKDPTTGLPNTFVAFFRREDAQVIDTWNPMGMRGTGSADIAVKDVVVPDRRVQRTTVSPSAAFSGSLYHSGSFPVAAQPIPALAAAENAVDALVRLGATKVPALVRGPLGGRELAQHHLGKARTLVEAGKHYLFAAVRECAEGGAVADGPPLAQRKQLQMAACFAADAAVEAVDLVCKAAGTSSFAGDLGFERYFRDVHTITHHAAHSENRYTSVGKVELGMPGDVPTLR
jgi:alkylation response protein AidB-like acyl-CoA dehydrogenase